MISQENERMKMKILLAGLSALSMSAFGGVCSDSIRIKGVYMTEKRVEVETKKDNVSLAQIITCLRANSDELGGFRFEKPSKEDGKKTFKLGKRVMISRDEYDPHHWIFSYRHTSELLRGPDSFKQQQISQILRLTRKNRLSENLILDVFGGIVISRGHLINPDAAADAANDVAPQGGLRLRIRTAPKQEFSFGLETDRFYYIDTTRDTFAYRGHFRIGWEGMISDAFSVAPGAGVNKLSKTGSMGQEIGLQFKFRVDHFTFVVGSQYETVGIKDATLRGFAHSAGLELLF